MAGEGVMAGQEGYGGGAGPKKPDIHNHLAFYTPLTNVLRHSYITRKLAKWINHGPCLALQALNRFSSFQVWPIIAFIHLVEARFTHLLTSCQSRLHFPLHWQEWGRFVIGSQQVIQTTISWLPRMSMSTSPVGTVLVEQRGLFYLSPACSVFTQPPLLCLVRWIGLSCTSISIS